MSYHRLQIAPLFFIFFFTQTFTVFAQSYMPQERPFFKQSNQNIKGRIRDIHLIDRDTKKDVLILARQGTYPNWQHELILMQEQNNTLHQVYQQVIPADMYYYASIHLPHHEQGIIYWNDHGFEIHASQNGQWVKFKTYHWQADKIKETQLKRFEDPVFAPIFQDQNNAESMLLLMQHEFVKFSLKTERPAPQMIYKPNLPMYVSSSGHALPLELNFSAKQSVYYPSIVKGRYNNQEALFFHWMEHVSIFSWDSAKFLKDIHFNTQTENERDSGQAWSHVTVLDLNQDQHMDYIVNTSLGSPTQMKSKSRLHLGQGNGQVDMKGIRIKTDASRASGVIAYDLDHDGAYEYIAASAQLNIWTILKALTQKQVDITFSIFDSNANANNFKQALSQKKLTFGFSLSDLNLEGVLPNIQHDFNGDGLNDVFYAQNDRKLSIIFQKPNKVKHFAEQISANYEVKVPKYYRLGDINGDKKTDVVLFSTKPKKNTSFLLLLNQY